MDNISMDWKRVFVTVGTTRFDKLVEHILKEETLLVLSSRGCKELIIQLGATPCPPIDSKLDINIKTYDYKEDISDDIKGCDLVVGHAGAGTTREVLRLNKPLLVVINEDLMGNHQKELADRLETDGYLFYCTTNTLVDSLISFDKKHLKPFPQINASLFANFIDNIFFGEEDPKQRCLKSISKKKI